MTATKGTNLAELEDRFMNNLGLANKTYNNDGGPKSADANRIKNGQADEASKKETAQILLRGYPKLRGKTCIEVTGVGKGSGKWYCKTVIHTWSTEAGYITQASLTKGKGGGGNNNPGGSEAIEQM